MGTARPDPSWRHSSTQSGQTLPPHWQGQKGASVRSVWAHNGLSPGPECFHQHQLIPIGPHSSREPGAAERERERASHHCPNPEDLISLGTSWTNREWPCLEGGFSSCVLWLFMAGPSRQLIWQPWGLPVTNRRWERTPVRLLLHAVHCGSTGHTDPLEAATGLLPTLAEEVTKSWKQAARGHTAGKRQNPPYTPVRAFLPPLLRRDLPSHALLSPTSLREATLYEREQRKSHQEAGATRLCCAHLG